MVLATAALLALSGHPIGRAASAWPMWQGRLGTMIHYLGARSYALFLLHFPVSMLVNAAQDRFDWVSPTEGMLAMLVAWLLSMVVADIFYRTVERQGVALSRRIG